MINFLEGTVVEESVLFRLGVAFSVSKDLSPSCSKCIVSVLARTLSTGVNVTLCVLRNHRGAGSMFAPLSEMCRHVFGPDSGLVSQGVAL